MADKYRNGKYNSDFAEQVTSSVDFARQMTINFSNNNLNFNENFVEGYKTSKTRVCVTVGMMTTEYDCRDILNLALMRPIFSTTDFVQMKGMATKTYTFKYKDENNKIISKEKQNFKLFDFFANCEYFEEKFYYDEKIEIPKGTIGDGDGGGGGGGE